MTDMASGVKDKFAQQWGGLLNVPMQTLMQWPAFFSFALVRTGAGMVINAIPNVGGYPGMILNYGILGFSDVVKFVTWDNVKMH